MTERAEVRSAADLEQLSLAERQQLAADSIVTDLSDVDPEFVTRARRRGRELLAERRINLPPE